MFLFKMCLLCILLKVLCKEMLCREVQRIVDGEMQRDTADKQVDGER